jgi:hypothetical protein
MRRRIIRNVVFLLFLGLGVVSLHAYGYPDELCSNWECGNCTYTPEWCSGWGGPVYTAYSFSSCQQGNWDMCVDNEFTCMFWCEGLAPALDACLGVGDGCVVSWASGSTCDEMAGSMSCQCAYLDTCSWK